jgi:hypothetical protein
MNRIKNLVGRKFGRLKVLEITLKRKKGSVVWSCQCECGSKIMVSSWSHHGLLFLETRNLVVV